MRNLNFGAGRQHRRGLMRNEEVEIGHHLIADLSPAETILSGNTLSVDMLLIRHFGEFSFVILLGSAWRNYEKSG
jgi:hypothetical protein